jgi:hypothetical protein
MGRDARACGEAGARGKRHEICIYVYMVSSVLRGGELAFERDHLNLKIFFFFSF